MSLSNRLRLDYKNNEELKSSLEGFQPGDYVTLEVKVMVTSNDDAAFEADVDEVTAESESEESAEEPGGEEAETETKEKEPAKADAKSPVGIVMAMRRKPKDEKEKKNSFPLSKK